MSEEASRFLVLQLGESLSLTLHRGSLPGSLLIGGDTYHDAGFGEFTGFYDWLRSAQARLVGVRYWPFDDLRNLIQRLETRPYAVVDPAGRSVDIWFGPERGVVQELSTFQDFGGNRVFVSASGKHAISFQADRLDETELAALSISDDPNVGVS